MNVSWLVTITAAFLLFIPSGIKAQETVATSGGNAAGSGGTVNFTVGQVTYTFITGITGTVAQGAQQTYAISEISKTGDDYGIHLDFSVYPNPVRETLKLTAKNYTEGILVYQLFDSEGGLLESKEMDGDETLITMDLLPPSIYFLKVTDEKTEIRTFKIVKY